MSERSSFPADLKITDVNYKMQKQSEVASGYSVESKSALAKLIASDEPRFEHYALTQPDPDGRMDKGANKSMTDRSLGLVEITATAAGIGVQNQSVSKSGAAGFSKSGTELSGDDIGRGKSPLPVPPGTTTRERTSSPAMIKAPTPEPYENVLMGSVSGVHMGDTLVGHVRSSKSGTDNNGMGDRVGEELMEPVSGLHMGDTMAAHGRHIGTVNNGDVPQLIVGDRVDEVLMGPVSGVHMGDTLAAHGRHIGTVNNGEIVEDRVGEFFDLNGVPILAKRNTNDAIGVSAMGDNAGNKGDRGSKGDRALGARAGSRVEEEVVPLSSMTQKRPQERIQVISGWKSLFSAKTVTKSPLEFVAPEIVNGKPVIEPPTEAVVEGMMLWEDCLVGQFFDKRLPLHVVRAAIEKLWGKKEIPEISITDNGLYLFRFRDMTARDWVMDCGPWYIAGRPFVIRRWQPGMEMLNIQLTSLPIWVKFYNIPLKYWTNTSLGCIVSAVGKPLHLDSPTENRSRLSFARICIEVDLNCDFPKSALLKLGNDKYTTVRIEYPWVPHSCSHCKIYGHKTIHCPISKATNTKEASAGPNTSEGNVGDLGFASGTNVVVGNSLQKEFKLVRDPAGNQKDPVKDSVGGVDSIIESITIHQNIISQDGPVQVGEI